MKRKIIFAVLVLSLCNCKNNYQRNACSEEAKSFISKLSSFDLSSLYGMTIEFRGKDENGKKLTRITYTDESKNKLKLPTNFSSRLDDKFPKFSQEAKRFSLLKFSKVDSSAVMELSQRLSEFFNSSNLYRIHSQLHLGEFIEFELSPNCSIWYKEEDVALSENYKVLFDEAEVLQSNWYIIKRKRLAPLLNGHPPNMEIEK